MGYSPWGCKSWINNRLSGWNPCGGKEDGARQIRGALSRWGLCPNPRIEPEEQEENQPSGMPRWTSLRLPREVCLGTSMLPRACKPGENLHWGWADCRHDSCRMLIRGQVNDENLHGCPCDYVTTTRNVPLLHLPPIPSWCYGFMEASWNSEASPSQRGPWSDCDYSECEPNSKITLRERKAKIFRKNNGLDIYLYSFTPSKLH